MIKTYDGMTRFNGFYDRFDYLKLDGQVGIATFGGNRYINQNLYRSSRWKSTRSAIILRDEGCDLGVLGHEVHGRILVHHINPIDVDDLVNDRDIVYDPQNLITVSFLTHQAIHFGDKDLLPKPLIDRKPGDTKLW